MQTKPLTIKRYSSNRKLYVPKAGYITLALIRALVVDKIEFQVIDDKTKKDITNKTLKQALGDMALSTNILKGLIDRHSTLTDQV